MNLSNLTNAQLIARINSLPDFKWDDEGTELEIRKAAGLKVKFVGNTLVILNN